MAFHIQHPDRRNLLLEGIIQGSNRGQEEASQMRLMQLQQQNKQAEQQKQLNVLSEFFGGNQGDQQQVQKQQGMSLESLDPIQAHAMIAALPIGKEAKDLLSHGLDIRRKEANIPLDVLSKEALQSSGFTEEDLNKGLLNESELNNILEMKQYLAQNAKSQKEIPSLVAKFQKQKQDEAFNKYVEQPKNPKEELFGEPEVKSEQPSILERRQELENRKEMQKQGITETKDIRKELTQKARTAKENNQRLGALEKLNEKDLGSPTYVKLLEKAGFNIGGLLSPDQEVYQKAVNDFTASAKNTYGGRVTNFELERFMARLPTLQNSKEGRTRIIQMQKLQNDADILRDKTKQDIIKENKGFPPLNLEDEIEERISPELDKMADKYAEIATGDKVYESFPNAKEFKGQEALDEETGDVYYSNGKDWVKK